MLAESGVYDIIGWSLALLALLVIGYAAAARIKRALQASDETSGVGFTLSDLRQMHRSGQMTNEEFEKAKALVLQTTRRAVEKMNPPPAKPAPPGVVPPSSGPAARDDRRHGFDVVNPPKAKREPGDGANS